MKIRHYKPKNKTLREYIESYYIINKGTSREPIHYLTFPNNFNILTTSQNCNVEMEKELILIVPSDEKMMTSNLVLRYIKPFRVFYQEPVNEVTIKFKPLGIHRFVANISKYLIKEFHTDFEPFNDLNQEMEAILSILDKDEQVHQLENYWLSKFIIAEVDRLQSIVNDIENELRIAEIAKKHNISRQYLSKIFIKNLGKTPSEYRKVHKFERSLQDFYKVNNLTELSYYSNFYDQSNFIKEFKSLTNIKPGLFFKKTETNKEVNWLFL